MAIMFGQAQLVLNRYRYTLLAIPGTVAVYVGMDEGQVAIIVEGIPDLATHQVPLTLDQVPVRVEIVPEPPEPHLFLGGPVLAESGGQFVQGSAGAYVQDGDSLFLLTAAHLWPASAQIGTAGLLADGKRIGRLTRWAPFTGNTMLDLAAVELTDRQGVQAEIPLAGSPVGIRGVEYGQRVWKYGAASGLTNGRVIGLDASTYYISTSTTVHTVFRVAGMTTEPGDSGGVVFDEQGYVVGVVSGGSAVGGLAYCTHVLQGLPMLGFRSNTPLLVGGTPFRIPQGLESWLLPAALVAGMLLVSRGRS